MRVLIVEDDKILARTIEQCLSDKYDIDKAYDGEEGVMYAKQGIYDAIILDIMMPVMNGYEVLQILRKDKVYTPVLILTAKGAVGDKVQGLKNGADDYLVKPFNREELLARVEAIIRRTTGNYGNNTVEFKDMVLDLNSRTIFIKDEEVFLQGKQFDMLEYLVNSKNTIQKIKFLIKFGGLIQKRLQMLLKYMQVGLEKSLRKVDMINILRLLEEFGYIWS